MTSQSMPPAERIRELSSINGDIAKLIKSAGQAINTLTTRPLENSSEGEDAQMSDHGNESDLEKRKQTFTAHTEAYYSNLQSITSRLRRQAYALEEAGIISAEAPTLSSSTQARPAPAGPGKATPQTGATQYTEHVTNGGLGNLDVGWLNSRGNKVSAEKESELVAEAKSLLEQTLKE